MSAETPSRIEPCLLEAYPPSLADLLAELVRESTTLGQKLHPGTAASLSELVRVMNCYLSNLIEGHDLRPRDIERALAQDLDADATRRDLQLEARAHIHVQRDVDALCAAGTYGEPASEARIRWLHREFYEDAPASMLRIESPGGPFDMVPGEYRSELSLEALTQFVSWFCAVSLDQLRFMSDMFDLPSLEGRLRDYVLGPLGLPREAWGLCAETRRRGELPRGVACADVLFPRLFPAQL